MASDFQTPVTPFFSGCISNTRSPVPSTDVVQEESVSSSWHP